LEHIQEQVQKGIFNEGYQHSHFLEFRLKVGVEHFQLLTALRSALTGHCKTVDVITAFSTPAWELLQPNWSPEETAVFQTLEGDELLVMPATQNDLLLWLQGDHEGDLFNSIYLITHALADVAEIVVDVHGFKTHENRDLTGFVDGTANPKEDDRFKIACIPDCLPGAGGSYLFTQKWQHHLSSFNSLTVIEQEAVIGRTKQDDRELEGDEMPITSHVSRTDLKENGEAVKIYRRSSPFGTAKEHGLFFVGCSATIKNIHLMLESMLGLRDGDEGITDHLMKYSTPETGSYWFAPSAVDLNHLLFS